MPDFCVHRLRRSVSLTAIAAMASAFGWTGVVAAQPYPARPITMIVPFPAGGATDTLARYTPNIPTADEAGLNGCLAVVWSVGAEGHAKGHCPKAECDNAAGARRFLGRKGLCRARHRFRFLISNHRKRCARFRKPRASDGGRSSSHSALRANEARVNGDINLPNPRAKAAAGLPRRP
jgi:hypothetical protein